VTTGVQDIAKVL